MTEDDYNPLDQPSLDDERDRHEKDALRAEEDARAVLRWWSDVLSTPIGRREIWRRIDAAGTFRRGNENYAMSPGGVPADRATDYHMGARDYGLAWWTWLEVNFTEWAVLLRIENDPQYAQVRRHMEDTARDQRLGLV